MKSCFSRTATIGQSNEKGPNRLSGWARLDQNLNCIFA